MRSSYATFPSERMQLQKQKKGAVLYTAIRGMLRKTGSPLLERKSSPEMAEVVVKAVEQGRGGGGGAATAGGYETPTEEEHDV